MPEKLLTINETSRLLGISEQEVKRLVNKGELPAYQVGGRFLRFRKEQIEAVQNEILAKGAAAGSPEKAPSKEFLKVRQEAAYSESLAERLSDFFYFNDFYIIAATIALLILWFIFK
ncbi:MAG: helix-turn-helix domain-containing protein [Candidatus Omnitrophota bacterium]